MGTASSLIRRFSAFILQIDIQKTDHTGYVFLVYIYSNDTVSSVFLCILYGLNIVYIFEKKIHL